MTNDRPSLRDRAGRGQASRQQWLAQREQLNEQVRANVPTLDAILPSHMNAAQFAAIVSGLIARNDDLALAAMANPVSFMAAIADCARLGLVPGDGYALIPLGVSPDSAPGSKAEVLGMAEYTGEIQLIFNTGLVKAVHAEVVFANDHYVPGRHAHDPPEWSRGPTEFATDAERGAPVGAFCYCEYKDTAGGGTSRVVRMNREEIMAHREIARTKKIWDGPFWRSMWLKTVTHEEKKWVARSAENRQQADRSAAALASSPLGELPVAPAVELDTPSLRVRAIEPGNGNEPPPRRRGRKFDTVVERFEQIGCTSAGEQLRVVQAVVPDYVKGQPITDEQADAVLAQLQQFIDGADDATGDPGEFTGRTPYDVLRDWLASPGPDDGVPEVADPE